MQLKEGFVTHEVAGEQVMLATGNATFSGLVRSNATAAFIVECLKEPTTEEAIVAKMVEKYDAPKEVIARDVAKTIAQLHSIGAIDV